jgi:hypothetical protein
MKEFYVSAKWKMSIPPGLTVAGGVILPSGVALHALERRDLTRQYPHLARRLLDPQLYLVGLNAATSRKACANLSSYPWFPLTKRVPYDSKKHKRQSAWAHAVQVTIHKHWLGILPVDEPEINDTIRLCLEVQKRLGVEAFILPAPLTSDINTPFDLELDWIEKGTAIASAMDRERPVYASIALSDTTLRGPDPWANPLLDVILDQVTARGVQHVYIVLEQANEYGYYCTHPHTVGALLRLCNGLKRAGVQRILVGYAGTAGLVALAAGADAWTSGWYRSERRLKLADFEDPTGRAIPAYYSHPLAGEFHLEEDLDNAVRRGFLPRITDETPASQGLLAALSRGVSSNAVPEWQYRQSNVAAAIEHFLLACVRETAKLAALSEDAARAATKTWLATADQIAASLYSIGSFHPRTSVNHQAGWLAAFERYEKNRT